MPHLTYLRWQIDTCSCIVYQYYDADITPVSKIFFAVENVCPDHQNRIGLDKEEPEWVQPDHTVDTEIAARFAMLEDAWEENQQRNLAGVTDPGERTRITRETNDFANGWRTEYSKFLIPDNANFKQLSKAVYSTAKGEADLKNGAMRAILLNGPNTLYDIAPDGISRVLKGNIILNISWTGIAPDRILNLSISGVTLTNAQKNTIRSAIDSTVGVGKVVFT